MPIGIFISAGMIISGYIASRRNKDEMAFLCVIGAIFFIGY